MSGKRTILVTGSTSGIGQGIARAFAAEETNIILNGFGDRDKIEADREALASASGATVIHDGADLTKPNQIETMMKAAAERFGGVDVLVNNAGVQHVSAIEDFPIEKWDLIIALNLTASFHTIRHAMPWMKERRWGRIINIASAHALVASPFKSAYVSAKHGLAGLTKTVALEGAEHGVRCNAICPGYVHTPLVDGQIADTAKSRGMSEDEVKSKVILAAQPTKEFVTVEQIGAFAVFLTSPAADQINGSMLQMDGGWVAQ